jgi:hypothetical protein
MRLSILVGLVSCCVAAPTINTPREADDSVIPGKYIIKLKDGILPLASDARIASVAHKIGHEYYMGTFNGFAATFTDEEKAELEAHDIVCKPSGTFFYDLSVIDLLLG